eukprot:SAG25_NODE_12929_length_273_cov_1.172414_1_plen_61_part_01
MKTALGDVQLRSCPQKLAVPRSVGGFAKSRCALRLHSKGADVEELAVLQRTTIGRAWLHTA